MQANIVSPRVPLGTSSLSERIAHISAEDAARQPLAWAAVRHQVVEGEKDDPATANSDGQSNYSKIVQHLDPSSQIAIRTVPDPSKHLVQHHLLRSRQLAGPDNYILALYCGHGIQEPPTEAGELWCYDRSFKECQLEGGGPSEYIPMMLFDVLSWAGSSTCFVWDVKHAGRFVSAAIQEAAEIDSQLTAAAKKNPEIATAHPAHYASHQIHFAACGADETLPHVPGMPDDLFTACLLTPLKIAMFHHNLQAFPLNQLDKAQQRSASYMNTLWYTMSGGLRDRLCSELTSILMTIAWSTLDSKTYHQLFGHEGQVVPKLTAGFMLAQRVMAAYGTTPQSLPVIPPHNSHSLWMHWDLIMENLFEQLPAHLELDGSSTAWEGQLSMLSFMKDQINTVLSASLGGGRSGTRTGLDEDATVMSRLPIILQAANTPALLGGACKALKSSLNGVHTKALDNAVHCGVLQVAIKLLDSDDAALSEDIISIWASLIRNDDAVKGLAELVEKAEYVTDVKQVVFFLIHLEQALHPHSSKPTVANGSIDAGSAVKRVIECTAVLSTIVSGMRKRRAPRFLLRCLDLVRVMLDHRAPLVQQWGALFCAELLTNLEYDEDAVSSTLTNLQSQVLAHVNDGNVETRAAMLHALSHWFKAPRTAEVHHLRSHIDLLKGLIPQTYADAAVQVRAELCNILYLVLSAATHWGQIAYWTSLALKAVSRHPSRLGDITMQTADIADHHGMTPGRYSLVMSLVDAATALQQYCKDPNHQIATLASSALNHIAPPGMRPLHTDKCREKMLVAEDGVDTLLEAGRALCATAAYPDKSAAVPEQIRDRRELFRRSKLSLSAHLLIYANGGEDDVGLKADADADKGSVWAMRHRHLEDSLVIAELQAGLPWKWRMKELAHADTWHSMVFHSFDSTVMSANGTNSLTVWDWAASERRGAITLQLPPRVKVKSGRFVNELHEHCVILAECNNGSIHVFAGPPHQPEKLHSVSSFLALDPSSSAAFAGGIARDKERPRLRTTWWRQSGMLGVAGSSRYINLWDCPAEQRVRYFDTEEESAVTTLITEPKSGNIVIAGFGNGVVKLFDKRQGRRGAVLGFRGNQVGDEYRSASGQRYEIRPEGSVKKLGVALGESSNISAACANGLINNHDLRMLSRPSASVLAQPNGIGKASFQPHSGLMSTVSHVNGAPDRFVPLSPAHAHAHAHGVHPIVQPWSADVAQSQTNQPIQSPAPAGQQPFVDWALHRSSLSTLTTVTTERIYFPPQAQDVVESGMRPFTVFHPLRPFMGIGYGRDCHLRGSGVGEGETADSGSFNFLQSQARYVQ